MHVLLLEVLRIRGRRWRLRNLGDEISSRCFCNAVDEDADEGNLDEDEECNGEAAGRKDARYTASDKPALLPILIRNAIMASYGVFRWYPCASSYMFKFG